MSPSVLTSASVFTHVIVIAIVLATNTDSVSGNVSSSVSLHVSQCFAYHLSEQVMR